MSEPAIHLRGIAKSFGQTRVLEGIDLAVAPGEFIALVGPSGCGKSTLLRIAAGLEAPDEGQVMLAGRDVTAMRAADRDMAMVFQSYALYPHLSARQNMALPLVMRRLSSTERLPFAGLLPGVRDKLATIRAEIEAAAGMLKITPLLERKPAHMSGGQRQRVALGRALVRHPSAFLMDEPLSNLDAALRVHMRSEIVDLHRRAGVVTLYVTHDQEEALGMADRVAVMLGGRILQVASPDTIYRDPAHIEVASFIGSPRINLLPAVIAADGQARVAGHAMAGHIAAPTGDEVRLGIRPEHLSLSPQPGPRRLPVRLDRIEFLGAEALVHCRAVGITDVLIARMAPSAAEALRPHTTLHAEADDARLLVFARGGTRVARVLASRRTAIHAE
ncbi:MAG: ABC transporter ATP-binding protein [Alphaproteobacteria bacterium]|nr:ABC transporter ATP-binding protein [Alphaproteobacteria bacterium]